MTVGTTFVWATLAALALSLSAPAVAETAGSAFRDCSECPEMVAIPAGTFLMGRKADPFSNEQQPPANEQPQHEVKVKSFALGKYEVTQEQWFALMGDNPSYNKGRPLPVENVSWDDIQVFLGKLNAKTGKRYRLPTEAEWEYAARAGSTTLYSFGDDVAQLSRYGWYAANALSKTHPIGEKLPNQFGLHDMAGNVWEWVQDCYNENYNGAAADGIAAAGPEDCDRVVRGGSWESGADFLRPAFRGRVRPTHRVLNLGFRVALPVE